MNQPSRRAVAITVLAAVGMVMIIAQILGQPAPSDHRDPGVVLSEGAPTSAADSQPGEATSSPAPNGPAPIGDVATDPAEQPTVPATDGSDEKDYDKEKDDDEVDD